MYTQHAATDENRSKWKKKHQQIKKKKMFVVWFLDYSGWLLSVTQWSM